jgi:superfamily II DNA helicase RecQ
VYRCKKFRKDFKRIGEIRALVNVPIVALTASAPQVQADITNPITVSCCLDRPNVFISASPIATLSVSNIHNCFP